MAKSARERMAEYRRRKRENPEEHEQYKASERERYYKRKAKGEIKMIGQLSDRAKRNCRRRWVQAKRESRARNKLVQLLTPPSTPERNYEQDNQPHQQNDRIESMRRSHKRRAKRQKSACYRSNEKLKVKLINQTRMTEKYRKRYSRLKLKFSRSQHPCIDNGESASFNNKSYKLYQTMIMNIRKWYRRTNSRKDKHRLADIICGKRILKRYGLGAYCRTILGISRRYLNIRNSVRQISVKKLNIKEKVHDFMQRDDNSRIKADKQATITRKGIKKQIRLMTDDLKTLHNKFQAEGSKISYSLFCELRPFWIRKPTEKDRSTCLCKIHENLNFKIATCYLFDMINTKDPNALMKKITCNTEEKTCMYRECQACGSKTLYEYLQNMDGKQVTWSEWNSKRVEKDIDGKSKVITLTVKEKKQATRETLAEELNKAIQRACRHYFNIRHQYQAMKTLKENLSPDEVLLHIDFSENYTAKFQSEIQSMHFGTSKQQISLHTGVAYIGDKVYPFCTVSDCIKHGPAAIWAHIDPVINYVKTVKPLSGIHFLTDGPTTQYRNKFNFFLWNKMVYDFGFKHSSWNFLEASHGKGAADGIGAAVKRAADTVVNVKGLDISSSEDFVRLVQSSTSIKLFKVTETSIDAVQKLLPSSLNSISGTMKLHQLTTRKRREISCRVLSCFCMHPSECNCYQPFKVIFPDTQTTSASKSDLMNMDLNEDTTIAEHHIGSDSHDHKFELQKVIVVDENLLGKYMVVEYDGHPFPGVVVDVDEDDIEVKVMHSVGRNRYFWPMLDDQCWYKAEKVVTLLDKEPQNVTARHCQIPPKIWDLIVNDLDI